MPKPLASSKVINIAQKTRKQDADGCASACRRSRMKALPPSMLRPKPAGSVRDALSTKPSAAAAGGRDIYRESGMRFLPQQFADRHDHGSGTREGSASRRENSADAVGIRIAAFLEENRERALENLGLPGGIDTVSYILLGMSAAKYPSDSITDVWTRYVVNNLQAPDGRWQCASLRPPLESSDFEVTAASIKAVRMYGPKSQRADYDKAAERAVRWLENAHTGKHRRSRIQDTWIDLGRCVHDRSFEKAAQALLTLQQSDGGWTQLPSLSSDAYATGQALVALHESGALPVSSPAYQRGVRFLLNSQLEDGSWYVHSRALPVQPYFDSGFPHGHDQFISAAATNWAAMALIAARD